MNNFQRINVSNDLEAGSETNIRLVSDWKHKFFSRII